MRTLFASSGAAHAFIAHSTRPEVPLSSRFTGRKGAGVPRRSIRPQNALASVPSLAPSVGCTTMPAGFSSTMACAVSYTMASGRSCGVTSEGTSGGSGTAISSPARTRSFAKMGAPARQKPCPRLTAASREAEHPRRRSTSRSASASSSGRTVKCSVIKTSRNEKCRGTAVPLQRNQFDQTTPCASIACATFKKPATFAPTIRLPSTPHSFEAS